MKKLNVPVTAQAGGAAVPEGGGPGPGLGPTLPPATAATVAAILELLLMLLTDPPRRLLAPLPDDEPLPTSVLAAALTVDVEPCFL